MTQYLLPDRIQWHEGMLLTPQHFQQESARVDALVAWHALAAQPLAWGLRTLEIDESLLLGGVVSVRRLQAVMPDGMAVTFDAEQAGDLQLDLAPHAEAMQQADVPVYLALGRARSLTQVGQGAMFRGIQAPLVADEVSQAEPVDIPRMAARLSVVAGERPSTAFQCLQLMTVRKDKEVCRRGAYLPALLDLPSGCAPRQRAALLVAQLRSKAAFLARQTAQPSSKLEERMSLLEQRFRLSCLMSSLPALEALLRSPSVPPFALYLALCAQLGSMAQLRPGALAPQPPAWDPAALLGAFEPVLQALEDLAGEVSQQWRAEVFRFDGDAFSLDLQPQWLTGGRLVIGLRGAAASDLAAWMASAVIGSHTVWTTLNERRVLGAARRAIDEAPELGLRASAGYALFAVDVDDSVIVPGQPLVVSNAHGGAARQRPEEMVLFVRG